MDLLVDARAELFDLAVRSGLKVLETMLEEDRTAICGLRYAHVADRQASRAGTVSSEVVLGGSRIGAHESGPRSVTGSPSRQARRLAARWRKSPASSRAE